MPTVSAKVTLRRFFNSEMLQLQLKAPEKIAFRAGQYFLFHLGDKTYPYSAASAPDEEIIEFHIQNTGRHPLDPMLWLAFQNQNEFEISGPFGEAYWHDDLALPTILIAGGGGFSQIQSILKAMLSPCAHNAKPEQKVYLYWGVRSSSLLYRDSLCKEWQRQNPNFHYTPVISDEMKNWHGRTGLVHEAVIKDFGNLAGFAIYCSGPFPMSYAVRDAFVAKGADSRHIFSDAFAFVP